MKDKELNIIEAMKMPIETKFEVLIHGEYCHCKIIKPVDSIYNELVWDNKCESPVKLNEAITQLKFIPIPQPVNFMDALKSDYKCNIKNNVIENVHNRQITDGDDEYKISIVQSLLEGNYCCMNDIIYAISGYMGCDDWEKFIINGEFYLENEDNVQG